MTSSAGTNPRAADVVVPERLERHGVNTLSDAGLLTIPAGPNGGRTADAVLDECGAVPEESAGGLARIDGVTPRTIAIIMAAVCTGTPRATPPARPS